MPWGPAGKMGEGGRRVGFFERFVGRGGEAGDRGARARGGRGGRGGGGNGRARAHLGHLRADEGFALIEAEPQGPDPDALHLGLAHGEPPVRRKCAFFSRAASGRAGRRPPGDDGRGSRPFARRARDDATGDVRGSGEPRPSNLRLRAIFLERSNKQQQRRPLAAGWTRPILDAGRKNVTPRTLRREGLSPRGETQPRRIAAVCHLSRRERGRMRARIRGRITSRYIARRVSSSRRAFASLRFDRLAASNPTLTELGAKRRRPSFH